jgi:hypothetical protein
MAVTELKPSDPKAVDEITRLTRYVSDIPNVSDEYQRGA